MKTIDKTVPLNPHSQQSERYRSVLNRLGSPEDQERVRRGFCAGYDLRDLAVSLLEREYFSDCPLPVLTYPPAPEPSDYESEVPFSDQAEQDDLRREITGSGVLPGNAVTNELMKRIMAAEAKLAAWGKPCETEPYFCKTSRKDEDAPWNINYGLKLSARAEELVVEGADPYGLEMVHLVAI